MDAQALWDKLEIHELLARYGRAVDDRDWDLYRSLFTPDAHIDYTSAGAIAGTVDEVVAYLRDALGAMPWTQHYLTNVEVDLDGDEATARAMFFNPLQIPGLAEPSSCGGWYLHRLVRTPDGWRSRQLVEDLRWFVNSPFTRDP
ncbi:MAG TPA: nuclear transport factor 2 family protein [Acidimicrobiales bacterium]|nr:nuclear transport factor 2 family protein [Acidimicrobiales bacterium]